MTESLAECERDVERARAKLASDLTTLRSPETFASFTDGLKQEAFDAKDSVIQHAKEAVQTSLVGLVNDLKAKAAANTVAALTIGAGIAWRLVRNPPIATALIGAGLFSLWRTQAFGTRGRDNRDYLEQGKRRFKQQLTEFGTDAAGVAGDLGQAISERTERLYDRAKDKVQDWSHGAAETAAGAGATVTAQPESLAASAHRTFHDAMDQSAGFAKRASDKATTTAKETISTVSAPNLGPGSRDMLLLGVAGLAVAGALGIAFQKRIAIQSDAGRL
jgi:gas vesicle protein